MEQSLKQKVAEKVDSLLPPNINSASTLSDEDINRSRLGVFGGESQGFATDVLAKYGAQSFYVNKAKPDAATVSTGMKDSQLYRAIFNHYALYNYRGFYSGFSGDNTQYFRDQPDNKIHGGEYAHNLTATRVIEFYNDFYPKIAYKPADFIFGKYYNRVPLNHLVTLRRFALPVEDNIFDLSKSQVTEKSTETIDALQYAGVTAVTYLGETAGNPMEELLKYSYGLRWKKQEAEMQTIQNQDGGYTSQPFYSKIGGAGRAFADTLKGVSAQTKFEAQNRAGAGTDRLSETYANFVLGPINVIDETQIRDTGLDFSNDMKLVFEYELRSLNYVNPKIAMIDLISNMMTMTTNNAAFFGGGQRYYGSQGYVASQFGDVNKLRRGDFSGYIGSVVSDVENGFKSAFGGSNGNISLESLAKGALTTGKTLLGNVLGQFLGGQVGSIPGTEAVKALISAEPTGNWHITIGNPLNPIVTAGNMICDETTMTLGNGLGYDDFPMEVKFEISLKHGKPRDKGDIENMFNAGRGRIYASSLGEKDVLNLKGADVKVYGAIQNVGTQNKQKTMSDKAGYNPNAKPADAFPANSIKKSGAVNNNDDIGNLSANLVSMIIDS